MSCLLWINLIAFFFFSKNIEKKTKKNSQVDFDRFQIYNMRLKVSDKGQKMINTSENLQVHGSDKGTFKK